MDTLLTTGEVAKLCGVTPDAVLKWIKKGRLPATRTVGGHYRVSRETCVALGLVESNGDVAVAATPTRTTGEQAPQRCWEYFGDQGAPPETCRNCLVYQARAQFCYRLAELGEEVGHRHDFCTSDCQECPFYRACHGMSMTVLVITRDDELVRRLEKHYNPEKVSLHFAGNGYEGSTLIGELRPAVVVMDSDLPEVREGTLPASVARDARIPGARLFLTRREGTEEVVDRLSLPTLGAPFTAKQIEQLAASDAA